MNNIDCQQFSDILTAWFQENKRDLPWRHTTNPYLIWLSEIILQQTRVAQGLDYFNRFAARFPDIRSLAQAGEDEIMKYWQGLGYYSRARNLHAAARQMMEQHHGKFPHQYEQTLALKGVGEYTAAAICSFAYNLPYAVLDGNVYRVLARVFGIETPINALKAKKEFSELAQALLDKRNPSLHNQAIMEFGALQCVPISPDCVNCPLQAACFAYINNKVAVLPVKLKAKKAKERFFNYFFVLNNGSTYLKKRTGNDIWKNLYEFPLIETESPVQDLSFPEGFKTLFPENAHIAGQSAPIKHVLTHRIINAVFYTIYINVESEAMREYVKMPLIEVHDYPVSRLMEIFLENIE